MRTRFTRPALALLLGALLTALTATSAAADGGWDRSSNPGPTLPPAAAHGKGH